MNNKTSPCKGHRGAPEGQFSSVIFLFILISDPAFIYFFIFSGEPIYESCLSKVEKMIYKRVQKAEEVKHMEFYAFSYYYDRAVDLGFIGMHCTISEWLYYLYIYFHLTVCHHKHCICVSLPFLTQKRKMGASFE